MDLSDKIKQILTDKNITPSIFADEIGIQRSSISHILAGRNKPSLDIVQKIVKRFPELGLKWILDDEPLPTYHADHQVEIRSKNISESIQPKSKAMKELQKQPDEKSVEKILIFYSDGTFQEFRPGK
ncbi:helix-turn-helix transcriptional regulator [Dyadobacter arcticus]|uniref:Transcriptional regulator with XRE-family HTH domain n=1 Tax=Dyadobacter arcticus TaxID=1078754 RepID=A0ABX0UMA4_9BACT|nr:helix-turn-helix transcriptional regulator [Dyadobacter arcticus]NIJ54136.1 transcriptional regulator with XRE-family HTH domain [Dyadobacter arcticus]